MLLRAMTNMVQVFYNLWSVAGLSSYYGGFFPTYMKVRIWRTVLNVPPGVDVFAGCWIYDWDAMQRPCQHMQYPHPILFEGYSTSSSGIYPLDCKRIGCPFIMNYPQFPFLFYIWLLCSGKISYLLSVSSPS